MRKLYARLIAWTLVPLALIGVSVVYGASNPGVGLAVAETTPTAQPPIGNNYPAGPAPTSVPLSVESAEVTLQVPSSLQSGVFASARTLTMPAGFAISVYAQLEGAPRMLAFSPDNVLFATEQRGGQVVRVTDVNGVGQVNVWASGLNIPHGIAFYTVDNQTYLYVAAYNQVVRYKYSNGQMTAGDTEVVVPNLPTSNAHVTRTIVFGADNKMYLSMGSGCNVCEEDDERRAAVMQFNPDGSDGRIFASGLRNGVGLALNPTTNEIWETENSRDILGDDMPPDEINILQDGANYGWPYCISNKVWDANFKRQDQPYCDTTLAPALPLQAHSAPLGISFYTGTQFPQDYQDDAFVSFHGSWNRNVKTGYKVVRIHVENGRPTLYEDFITGFLVNGNEWGRPVDPVTGPEGSLYLSDDSTNAIYKITYQGGS